MFPPYFCFVRTLLSLPYAAYALPDLRGEPSDSQSQFLVEVLMHAAVASAQQDPFTKARDASPSCRQT